MPVTCESSRLDGIDLLGDDVASTAPKKSRAGLDRHHHLFERGVAGALADAVDGALDLPRAVAHGGERVGDRHAEVVVAVRAPGHAVAARRARDEVGEQRPELLGHRVAGGVGNVERRPRRPGSPRRRPGPGSRGRSATRPRRRTRRGRRASWRSSTAQQAASIDLLPAHHQLALEVEVGGGDEDVDAGPLRLLDARAAPLRCRPAWCARGSARSAR